MKKLKEESINKYIALTNSDSINTINNVVEAFLSVHIPYYSAYNGEKNFQQLEERLNFLYSISIERYTMDELELRLIVEKYMKDFNRLDDDIVKILLNMCKLDVSCSEKKLLNLLLLVPAKTLNKVYREIKYNIYQNNRNDNIYILPKYKKENGQIVLENFFLERDEQNDLVNVGFIEPLVPGMVYGTTSGNAIAFSITTYGLKILDIFKISCVRKNKFSNIKHDIFDMHFANHFNQENELKVIKDALNDIQDNFKYLLILGNIITHSSLCIPIGDEQSYLESYEKLLTYQKILNEKKLTISEVAFDMCYTYNQDEEKRIKIAIDNKILLSYYDAYRLRSMNFQEAISRYK